MKFIKWLWAITFAFIVVLLYATITSFFVTPYSEWYTNLLKLPSTPNTTIISIGWTFNYLCTIFALARVIYMHGDKKIVYVFIIIGILNIIWSIFFFTLHIQPIAFLFQALILFATLSAWGLLIEKDTVSGCVYFIALVWVAYTLITGYQLLVVNL